MIGYLFFAGFIAVIVLANLAITHIGLVPVGFGLMAPAGVYFAGLAFGLRDVLQDHLGARAVPVAIGIGALLSLALADPFVAFASVMAFLASELLDFAVYTPIRRRHWLIAVAVSNTVGLIADSALFLMLAFGSLEFLWGQLVGKGWVTLACVALFALLRRYLSPRRLASAVPA